MNTIFLSYAESHSIKWVNALAEKGHKVYFIIQRNKNNHVEWVDPRVTVITLPFSGKIGYILNAPFLKALERKIKPDICNVHYMSGFGTMARLAKLKTIVASVWGADVYDFPYKNKICMQIIRKNLLNAKIICSTSNCMAAQVRKLIGSRRDIIVTPFGVDIDTFSNDDSDKKDDESIVIGNVKVLNPKYGIDDLLKAFALLRDELKSDPVNEHIADILRCHIYGDGEQRHELEELAKDLDIDKFVTFFGEIAHSAVPEALKTIDIFCATSVLDSESFGVSVVEAESMGLPVVVTDVDGFKEVVEDGMTGIIVERENISSIKDALLRLVLDPNERIQMGKNGRKRVETLYDFKNNVTQMESAYARAKEQGDQNE